MPFNDIEMPIPRGGSDAGRDLHSIAFSSKVSAFANVFQALETRRTNQFLQMQMTSQLQANIDENLSQMESSLVEYRDVLREAYSELRKFCESLEIKIAGDELLESLKALGQLGIQCEKLVANSLNLLRNTRSPQDLERFVLSVTEIVPTDEQFWALYKVILERATVNYEWIDWFHQIDDYIKEGTELDAITQSSLHSDSELFEYLRNEVEIRDKNIRELEEAKRLSYDTLVEFEEHWNSITEDSIRKFREIHIRELQLHKVVTEYERNLVKRISDIRDQKYVSGGNRGNADRSIEDRLEDLNKLFESELITKQEYEKKRKEVLGDL